MADLSLVLVLMFTLIIGGHSAPVLPSPVDARAATPQPGAKNADVRVSLTKDHKFILASAGTPLTADELVSRLQQSGHGKMAVMILQFPADTLAADLYGALLQLQISFKDTSILTEPENENSHS